MSKSAAANFDLAVNACGKCQTTVVAKVLVMVTVTPNSSLFLYYIKTNVDMGFGHFSNSKRKICKFGVKCANISEIVSTK